MNMIFDLLDALELRFILWLGSKGIRWQSDCQNAAHHEAAHALVCVQLRQLIICAFLCPKWASYGKQGGIRYDSSRRVGDKPICDRNDVIELLVISFVGRCADALFFPDEPLARMDDPSGWYADDHQAAHTTVRRYLAQADPALGALNTDDAALAADAMLRKRVEGCTQALFAEAEAKAEAFVLRERETIDALARALAERGYLSYSEICSIIDTKRLGSVG